MGQRRRRSGPPLTELLHGNEVFVGPPMANTQFYVVDEKQQPVAPGSSGELLIGGPGLALGYLKRPDLTDAKFIPDVLGNVPGGRLYRTGDEVRMKPDGRLQFLGRMDDQIKLRGFRIELGEIESQPGQNGGDPACGCDGAGGSSRRPALGCVLLGLRVLAF